MKNWLRKRPPRSSASPRPIERLIRIATANNDWAAVKNTSSDCLESKCRGSSVPPEMLNASGRLPISSVHWFTFEEIRIVIPASCRPRSASSPASMNSGASDARGASHCTSTNSSMPAVLPVLTRLSANGSAEAKITVAE